MKKYLWGIVAAVCVLALMIVGVVFIPPLFETGTQDEGEVEMIPAHWWETDLSEQQLEDLAGLWGSPVTAAQLLQKLWPDVLLQLPQEALGAYEKQEVRWPTEDFEDWNADVICGGGGVNHDEGMTLYFYYLGSPEYEPMTMLVDVARGFTEDRMYRVSLHTDIPEGAHPWSESGMQVVK